MDSSRLGSYVLIKRIAVGGMAEVFQAKRVGPEGFEKILAIKRIRQDLQDNPQWRPMFTKEARIVATLAHPNIVQVLDFGEIDGQFFLAMEFVDGVNLADLVAKQEEVGAEMPPHLAAYVIRQVLSALSYAHSRVDPQGQEDPIIHRDISPSNVLISKEGEVKLADFGIAKALGSDQHQSAPGLFKGKVHYSAPEQIWGEPADVRSDIYSTGILLYMLLTNRRPFEGSDLSAVAQRQLENDYPLIETILPELSGLLAGFVEKSLRQKRERRYQKASEFSADLDRFLAKHPSHQFSDQLARHVREVFGVSESHPSFRFGQPGTDDTEEHGDVTGTDLENSPRRKQKVYFLLTALASLGVGIFAWNEGEKSIRRRDAPTRVETSLPTVVLTEVPTPSPTTSPSPEPSTPTPPPTKVRTKTPLPKPPAPLYGTLTIFPSGPYADVKLDGKKIGTTPIFNFKTRVGKHRLVFENDKLGLMREMTIDVSASQETRLTEIWEAAP